MLLNNTFCQVTCGFSCILAILALVLFFSLGNFTSEKDTVITINELRIEERPLYVPHLKLLARALMVGLKRNYANVSVNVMYCPDLTQPPFNLASSGLSGSQILLDVGGDPYEYRMPNYRQTYDFVQLAQSVLPEAKSVFFIGAGVGPYEELNSTSQGIFNSKVIKDGPFLSKSYMSYLKPSDKSFGIKQIPSTQTKFSLLADLYASEGLRGEVIQIKVKKRIGIEPSFVEVCRKAIIDAFGNHTVALGGVFHVKHGSAIYHLIGNQTSRVYSPEDTEIYRIYEAMADPVVAVGRFITGDLGMNLHQEHFHVFSGDNWGAHYHFDTTPDTVEYEAYFNVAKRAIRVDRPDFVIY